MTDVALSYAVVVSVLNKEENLPAVTACVERQRIRPAA
jgi:hypothetical protein